jgi:hypothetical protein
VAVVIPEHRRLLLLQPVQVASRLMTGRIDWITLINGRYGYAVVIIGRNVLGESYGIR